MMPKRITYLEKLEGMPRGDFRTHWSTVHADIARGLPGVLAYRQNHVLSAALLPPDEDTYHVDGIVELWFTDDRVAHAGYESDVADQLAADEVNFLSGLTGGAVFPDGLYAAWPHKLWLLARWRDEREADHEAVTTWANRAVEALTSALGVSVNFLDPNAELLTREALRSDHSCPQIAIAFGFANGPAATDASDFLMESIGAVQGLLDKVHGFLAEEVPIV